MLNPKNESVTKENGKFNILMQFWTCEPNVQFISHSVGYQSLKLSMRTVLMPPLFQHKLEHICTVRVFINKTQMLSSNVREDKYHTNLRHVVDI